MTVSIDRYLSTLLSFAPGKQGGSRQSGDYLSLIHVPAEGPEEVYSLSFGSLEPSLMVARFRETVWDYLSSQRGKDGCQIGPRVDALTASVASDHPVFEYIDVSLLRQCSSRGDGRPGMDYYLLMWEFEGDSAVAECWEPYGREALSWMTLIGALQALASQFEYAVKSDELAIA